MLLHLPCDKKEPELTKNLQHDIHGLSQMLAILNHVWFVWFTHELTDVYVQM